jgi:hypothetical protein
MAHALIHHFPGGTKEQYEASIAVVHPSRHSLPKGQIHHAAGPSGGGWTILAVFDSKENWEHFRDGVFDASHEKGHSRWARRASPGDDFRSLQPAKIKAHSSFARPSASALTLPVSLCAHKRLRQPPAMPRGHYGDACREREPWSKLSTPNDKSCGQLAINRASAQIIR